MPKVKMSLQVLEPPNKLHLLALRDGLRLTVLLKTKEKANSHLSKKLCLKPIEN